MTENELLGWLRNQSPELAADLGNDAAVLLTPEGPPGPLAVTVDHQIEGVHFLPHLARHHPGLVAQRLLAVNLSDLAAMGAVPRWALLALAAPPDFDHRAFFRPLLAACRRYGVRLIGGDLARADRLHLSLTALGTAPPGGTFLERGAARPGDRLWIGGSAGLAAVGLELQRRGARLEEGTVRLPADLSLPPALAGLARRAVLRHLLPQPQLALGQWLATRAERVAALDLSDGLARDLPRLCRESGSVGAHLEISKLPVPEGFEDLCEALELDAASLPVVGGEDYVLLFTLPPEAAPPEALGCTPIGEVNDTGRCTWERDGRVEPLPDTGWDHLT